MGDSEQEELRDDFSVEITDLDKAPDAGRSWSRLNPRARRLGLAALGLFLLLVMGLLLATSSETRALFTDAFPRSTTTPNPATDSGSMAIYLRGNPTWGSFTLDGKALSSTPVIGLDQPLVLTRGLHTLIWQAQPFKARTCIFTVVDATTAKGPCFSTNEITASFIPGVEAMEIAFFASLNDLTPPQRAALTRQLQETFTGYNSVSQVQAGELYAVSEDAAQNDPSLCRPFESMALCYARAELAMVATLSLQVDTQTSSDDPCVISQQCDSYRQDCRALCEDPVVDYGEHQNISGWMVDTVVELLWSYTTLDGQSIGQNFPNSAIRGNQRYLLVSVRIDRGTPGDWRVVPFPTYGSVSDNPICTQATLDTSSVLSAAPNSRADIYVRQSASNLNAMAQGCLIMVAENDPSAAARPTPTPSADSPQAAVFLLRFGVLLAVNASAHKICPDLPVANTLEKNIAQQLQEMATALP